MKKIFHKCSMCSTIWKTNKKFLSDKSLKLNGFQPDYEGCDTGFLLFTHYKKNCCTTLAVNVNKFSDLYFGKKGRKKEASKRKKK